MEGDEHVKVNDDLEMVMAHKTDVPPAQGTSMINEVGKAVKEILFPDDPFRQFKDQSRERKCVLGLQYVFPIFEWAPKYSFAFFKSDVISGLTIACLAIPQSISYAKLANLPPLMGLYSSFVPPLIYAMLGTSKDMAVGTVAVVSLLLTSMLTDEVSPITNPALYMQLALTATFFAGVFQASLGIFRLGFIIDMLSHATIVGFMAGAATVVSLQQLKGFLGLQHFSTKTDIVSVMHSATQQVHKWSWESIVLGVSFLVFLLITRHISKKNSKLFWVSAAAPLTSIILGSLLVFCTHAEKHGIQIVGHLNKGLNPLSIELLVFQGQYLKVALKTGLICGLISLTEGIASGRTFALLKNYHTDGNKEMIAFGMMNVLGSWTSCYVATGAFSRSAVNFNAGCKTAVSNIVMAIAVMITLLFLTPLFHYTPMVVLSSIITSAMLSLIDIQTAYHLWKVDKIDFLVCMGGYFGVVFIDVETGLIIAVSISVVRVLMHVMRPHTAVLGNIPGTSMYRSTEQYQDATKIPGILILRIDSPIYFANANYLKDRMLRWIEEEEKLIKLDQDILHYIILDMGSVATIDTSGINNLEELKQTLEHRQLQLVLANPSSAVMEKLHKCRFIELLGEKWLFVTVAEAAVVCNSLLQA
ncbi:sulfate transporter 3.1 [Cryptomeria japonica]|uniref:sulfate transporter 3.1 n=1 Tax=Cryptomeria japonica TaxID=3369 RepID=UPI0027DA94B3|nr:sulfate transporter 3.1 [Cryptomeria japonica]